MSQHDESVCYGYYSKTQFENCKQIEDNSKLKNFPYIYYLDKNNKVVQVTEVKNSPSNSTFDDVVYLGELKKFHSVSQHPIKLE